MSNPRCSTSPGPPTAALFDSGSRWHTRMSMIESLQGISDQRWSDFEHVYRPLLLFWIRKKGVPLNAMEDVLQESLISIMQGINKYEHGGQRPSGAIGSAQQGLTGALGLSFQLQEIDYSQANFVHADLSPQQFDAAMQKRGESWWTMFSRLMQEGMTQARRKAAAGDTSGEVGIGELFGLLFSSDRELQLRRIMAEQFTDMEVLTAAFGGESGSTIITDRNAAALDVMRQQIAKGRERVAIFYGAAHMADFDQRLRKDFDLKPMETTWVEAWDLRGP
jgi:hypothetical protein